VAETLYTGISAVHPGSIKLMAVIVLSVIFYFAYGYDEEFDKRKIPYPFEKLNPNKVGMLIIYFWIAIAIAIGTDILLSTLPVWKYHSTRNVECLENFWKDIEKAALATKLDIKYRPVDFNFQSEIERQYVSNIFGFPIPWRIAHLLSATKEIEEFWREFMITYFDTTIIKSYFLIVTGLLISITTGEIGSDIEKKALFGVSIFSAVYLFLDFCYLCSNIEHALLQMNMYNKLKRGITLSSCLQEKFFSKYGRNFDLNDIRLKKIVEPDIFDLEKWDLKELSKLDYCVFDHKLQFNNSESCGPMKLVFSKFTVFNDISTRDNDGYQEHSKIKDERHDDVSKIGEPTESSSTDLIFRVKAFFNRLCQFLSELIFIILAIFNCVCKYLFNISDESNDDGDYYHRHYICEFVPWDEVCQNDLKSFIHSWIDQHLPQDLIAQFADHSNATKEDEDSNHDVESLESGRLSTNSSRNKSKEVEKEKSEGVLPWVTNFIFK